ncbi:hypothetical protein FQN54_004183 [Arachnomyces sp. PD_36]|nr:hypothetical protein FQN54_004183 [Arachnomyces sp. PD_36]
MFGNQTRILYGPSGAQRKNPQPQPQPRNPSIFLPLSNAPPAGRGLGRGRDGGVGSSFGLSRRNVALTPRLLGNNGSRSRAGDTKAEAVVISDSDDDEEEDDNDDNDDDDNDDDTSSNNSLTTEVLENPDLDDIIVPKPLTFEDFEGNNGSKRRSDEGLDEGYGSFGSGLGAGGYANKRVRVVDENREDEDQLSVRNGVSSKDREDWNEAIERSRRLREAARARDGSSSPAQTSRAPSIHRNRVWNSPSPATKPVPTRSEQKTRLNPSREENDVGKAWMQEQIARATAEKPRTGSLPRIIAPSPLGKKRQNVTHAPLRIGGGSIMLPVKVSREVKDHEKDVNKVTLAGEALARYLEKDPGNDRTRQEEKEYERIKERVDRGDVLNATERERLGGIKRNVERREYNLEQRGGQPKAPTASSSRKERPKGGAKHPQGPITALGRAEMRELKEIEENKKIEALERSIQSFRNPAEARETLRQFDYPPTKERSLELRDPRRDEKEDSSREDPNVTLRKTVAGKGLLKDTVTVREKEASPEPLTPDLSSPSDEEEDESDIEPEPLWQYDVYKRETDPLNDDAEPVYIGTYFDPRRAEEVVAKEIIAAQAKASLEESSGFEVRCRFEENQMREQILTFSGSGRCFEVWIEKEVVFDVDSVQRPKKLASLPMRHYIVMEEITELGGDADDDLFGEESGPLATKRVVHKESYVLREDANEQASRLFIARQTAHLDENDKFDIEITGHIDTEGRRYLYELDYGERLFDKSEVLTGAGGNKCRVRIWVQGQLMRGPRN